MIINCSLAAWLGFPVSTALMARLTGRVLLLPPGLREAMCAASQPDFPEDL
jgi:hypothetical protein